MGIFIGYYRQKQMFKKNVIEKAVNEINYFTEIKVDVEYKKEKKKIKTVRFNIYRRNIDDAMNNADRAYKEIDGEKDDE